MSREPGNLIFRLASSLIFDIILVWKHFNFMAHLHIFLNVVEVKFQNIINIFLARMVGLIFAEDAIKFFRVRYL